MNRIHTTTVFGALLASLVLAGCTTYSQPRYGDAGVYYERAHHAPPARVHVDPLVYPYWSLDYFYFSRHYHPYSVVVHRYDPWFYPYPGWYYGYRPPVRSHVGISYRHYYPWYGRSVHYHHYRPWHTGVAFNYWHTSGPRYRYSSRERVRQENLRMQELRQRQALAARTPVRQRGPQPAVAPRIPASSRPHVGRVQQRQVPSSAHPRAGTRNMPTSPAAELRREREDLEPQQRRILRQTPPRATPESSTPRHEGRTGSGTPVPPPASRQSPPRTQPSVSPPASREQAPRPRTRTEPRTRRAEPPPSRSSAPRARDSAPARTNRTSERRRQRER